MSYMGSPEMDQIMTLVIIDVTQVPFESILVTDELTWRMGAADRERVVFPVWSYWL